MVCRKILLSHGHAINLLIGDATLLLHGLLIVGRLPVGGLIGLLSVGQSIARL